MTWRSAKLVMIGAIGALAVASPALAECGAISGTGSAANPQNYNPPRRYDMVTLAKAHAVGAWKNAVRSLCPGHSTSWTKARGKSISCEGYAGGTQCVATGKPRD